MCFIVFNLLCHPINEASLFLLKRRRSQHSGADSHTRGAPAWNLQAPSIGLPSVRTTRVYQVKVLCASGGEDEQEEAGKGLAGNHSSSSQSL